MLQNPTGPRKKPSKELERVVVCQPYILFKSIYFCHFYMKASRSTMFMNRNTLLVAKQWNGTNLIRQELWYTSLCSSSEMRSRAPETGKRDTPPFKTEVGAMTTYSVHPGTWKSTATVDNYCFYIRNVCLIKYASLFEPWGWKAEAGSLPSPAPSWQCRRQRARLLLDRSTSQKLHPAVS